MKNNKTTKGWERALKEFRKSASTEEVLAISDLGHDGRLQGLLIMYRQKMVALYGEGYDERDWIKMARATGKTGRNLGLHDRREVFRKIRRILSDDMLRRESLANHANDSLVTLEQKTLLALALCVGMKTARIVTRKMPIRKNSRLRAILKRNGWTESQIDETSTKLPYIFVPTTVLVSQLSRLGVTMNEVWVGRLYSKRGFHVGRTKIGGLFYRGIYVMVDSPDHKSLKRLARAFSVSY